MEKGILQYFLQPKKEKPEPDPPGKSNLYTCMSGRCLICTMRGKKGGGANASCAYRYKKQKKKAYLSFNVTSKKGFIYATIFEVHKEKDKDFIFW